MPRPRINATHSLADRGLDPYWTSPHAIHALIRIEHQHIPKTIWEPAAGGGVIVAALQGFGYRVVAGDVHDYGLLPGCEIEDYLTATVPIGVAGIITNPPFRLALEFARKAISEVPYVALLLRTNFLESKKRMPFFQQHPPTRIWIASRRLPMMHRLDWTGKKSSSNHCYSWFVWERGAEPEPVHWFDWAT